MKVPQWVIYSDMMAVLYSDERGRGSSKPDEPHGSAIKKVDENEHNIN